MNRSVIGTALTVGEITLTNLAKVNCQNSFSVRIDRFDVRHRAQGLPTGREYCEGTRKVYSGRNLLFLDGHELIDG